MLSGSIDGTVKIRYIEKKSVERALDIGTLIYQICLIYEEGKINLWEEIRFLNRSHLLVNYSVQR